MDTTTTFSPAEKKLDPWFSWTFEGRTHYGTLAPLDEWDKNEYKGLKLKKGQILCRYTTDMMNGRMKPLIAVNPDRQLIYHLKDSDSDTPIFETRGLKGSISLI